MNKIYPVLVSMYLAGCAPVNQDVLPTPDFKALEEKVEAPEEAEYLTYSLVERPGRSDYATTKENRLEMVINGNSDAQACDVRKVEGRKKANHRAKTFKNLLLGLARGKEKGELEFYGTNKGLDAVLLKQGNAMYIAVGKEELKLDDLWYFDSLDSCDAEVFENIFNKPGNKYIPGLVRKAYDKL